MMCRKDDLTTQQLIAGAISWADVPSDDDIMELEGWRAYEEVRNRAKNAYHRTIRSQKQPMQRANVKHPQPKCMERKPYHILKQEQTKHIVEKGRVTPVKEIVEVVVQPPVEYKEDVELIITQALLDAQVQPVETQKEQPTNTPVPSPITLEETPTKTPIIPSIEVPSHVTKRNSKETLKVHRTPIIYYPTFTELYLLPLIPYIILLLFIVCVMNL